MGIEDTANRQYPSVDEGSACYLCSHWHWACQGDTSNNLCKCFNMISREEADEIESEKAMANHRLDKLLNNNLRV